MLPSFDDSASTDEEADGLLRFERGVEDRTVRELALVVHFGEDAVGDGWNRLEFLEFLSSVEDFDLEAGFLR